MTAFWDIGLCELSDFTDFLGTRVMTYTALKARHKGKVLTGRHRKSFTLLCAHLGCAEGEKFDTAYQTGPTLTDLHSILKKYEHVRTTGLIARHNLEHEEEEQQSLCFRPAKRPIGQVQAA